MNIVFIVSVVIQPCSVDNDLLGMAKENWKLAAKLPAARPIVESTTSFTVDGKNTPSVSGSYVLDLTSSISVLRHIRSDGVHVSVKGRNPQYVFRLLCEDGPANCKPSYIGQLGDEFVESIKRTMYTNDSCYAPWVFHEGLVVDWLSRPGFTLLSFAEDAEKPGLVLMEFAYTPGAGESKGMLVRKGSVRFDRANLWCIHSIDFKGFHGRSSLLYEYAPPVKGFPVLRSIGETFTSSDKKVVTYNRRFNWRYGDEPHPEDTFKISRFGLGEPTPAVPKSSSLWLWLLAGAIILAVTSGWLWRRANLRIE